MKIKINESCCTYLLKNEAEEFHQQCNADVHQQTAPDAFAVVRDAAENQSAKKTTHCFHHGLTKVNGKIKQCHRQKTLLTDEF